MGFSDEKPRIRNIISQIIPLTSCLDIELPAVESSKRKALIGKSINAFLWFKPKLPVWFQGRIFRCHLNSHGRDRDVCDGCGQ